MVKGADLHLGLDEGQENRAAALHARSIVIDGSSVVSPDPMHFERARRGGVTVTNHTVTLPPSRLETALHEVNTYRRWIAANPSEVLLATSTAEIRTAKDSGRQAVVFGPQNAEFLDTDLDLLGTFYDLGVRILQLTYQRQNYIGSGCGEHDDAGLTTFGRRIVAEMDQLGIVVDLSHCGPRTALDAIENSAHPVVFSHAHPASVSPHIRAKSDELLKALAARGGVIGITALSPFLYDPTNPMERPGLGRYIEHIQYVVDLIGVDHVGIGLDFDETHSAEKWDYEIRTWPELDTGWSYENLLARDLTSAADAPNITRALVAAGFADEEIEKILGLNFLRVFDQVWKGK